MRAAYVAVLAFLLLIVGRWAHNKPAFTVQTVAAAAFVIFVIAALDGGRTEQIAKGLAWLLLVVVALNPDSPVTAIARLINTKAAASAGGGTPPVPNII
jgi:hypothetical protein